MLYNKKDLPELNYMKHRHDNNLMRTFLKKMQPLVSILFDQMNVIKNFKNYTVDKYYYKHNK